MAELRNLFDYTDHVWGEFRRVVANADLAREAPGSGWPTLQNCLGHMLAAHERWVPAILRLQTGSMPEYAPGDLATWTQLDNERERVRAPLREALDEWTDDELSVIHEVDVDGEPLRYSRGDLVTHLLLHERGHHGDVTTLFWQLGIDADVAIEYRFFLDRRPQRETT